ncbi:MAG: hypothetical protein KJZ92_02885 [Rhodocyclaceae bacterium]|jgi:hypothetical protein|nr:hypothetical protein [Rhodocyclaceae bacterium]MBZ0142280.1 hypothetical protein [Rhodocyclaceae bacterium]MCL4680194.1 hypothetical protein [Rhodocyclaceae bacterium]
MARLLYASILVAAMLTPPAALAEQTITFKVPVQLSNLHSDVKKFSVSCTLRNKANPLATYAFDRTDLEVNKNFSGTVSVNMKVPDSVATEVNAWDCTVLLFHAGGGCAPAPDSPIAACKTKAGAPSVTKVQGTL